MDKGSIIDLPPDLFAAIDNAHKKASAIYKGLDKEALALLDSNRYKKESEIASVTEKIKRIKTQEETKQKNKIK